MADRRERFGKRRRGDGDRQTTKRGYSPVSKMIPVVESSETAHPPEKRSNPSENGPQRQESPVELNEEVERVPVQRTKKKRKRTNNIQPIPDIPTQVDVVRKIVDHAVNKTLQNTEGRVQQQLLRSYQLYVESALADMSSRVSAFQMLQAQFARNQKDLGDKRAKVLELRNEKNALQAEALRLEKERRETEQKNKQIDSLCTWLNAVEQVKDNLSKRERDNCAHLDTPVGITGQLERQVLRAKVVVAARKMVAFADDTIERATEALE